MKRFKAMLLAAVCGCGVGINDVGADHSTTEQTAAGTELISTLHSVRHTQLTLDHPPTKVWPVFKDIKRWYTEYTIEVLSGPPYPDGSGLSEGQVLKVKSPHGIPRAWSSGEAAQPEYFIVKIIKVVPQREIVSVLSGRAYDFKQYTTFYVWKLAEKEGKTTIFVDSYGEAELVKPLPKNDFMEYRDRLIKNWDRSWSEAFANLTKVMDGAIK